MGRMRLASLGMILAIFGRGFRADGADPGVRGEVRHLTLQLRTVPENTDLVALDLRFDLHIANGSRRPIGLPAAGDGQVGSEGVTILGVESQAKDGGWTSLLQGTFIDNGTSKYEPCISLRPGSEGDVGSVKTWLPVLKKQLAALGEEPTIRLHVTLTCRQPRGGVRLQDVRTDAISMRLPSLEGVR